MYGLYSTVPKQQLLTVLVHNNPNQHEGCKSASRNSSKQLSWNCCSFEAQNLLLLPLPPESCSVFLRWEQRPGPRTDTDEVAVGSGCGKHRRFLTLSLALAPRSCPALGGQGRRVRNGYFTCVRLQFRDTGASSSPLWPEKAPGALETENMGGWRLPKTVLFPWEKSSALRSEEGLSLPSFFLFYFASELKKKVMHWWSRRLQTTKAQLCVDSVVEISTKLVLFIKSFWIEKVLSWLVVLLFQLFHTFIARKSQGLFGALPVGKRTVAS